MARNLWLVSAACTLFAAPLVGCNALDEPGDDASSKFVVPTDARPAVQALRTPPPISGGTLSVSADGRFAVAADPARDRVSIVELSTRAVTQLQLQDGDEPGRVVMDAAGRAHVALRRGGAVVSIDLQSGKALNRREVCAAPRGITHDSDSDTLFIACADGILAELPAGDGALISKTRVEDDLRDVAVRGDQLIVTRFKSAEALVLTRGGEVIERMRPPELLAFTSRITPDGFFEGDEEVSLTPHVAWRTELSTTGEVVMLHQNSSMATVDIEATHDPNGGDGSAGSARLESSGSPYGGGGGFGCEGIVQTSVSTLSDSFPESNTSQSFAGMVMAVDLALSNDGSRVAMAQAGSVDPDAPRPFTAVLDDDSDDGVALPSRADVGGFASSGNVTVFDRFSGGFFPQEGNDAVPQVCEFGNTVEVSGQPTAVAFTPDGALLVLSREPAILTVLQDAPFGEASEIELGGESIEDTGHAIFHRNSGGGIACASCHAEGGDDGHTWTFTDLGERRTQSVHVGLEGTAPFHWDGDMADLPTLMEAVFVGRMGGVHQSRERLEVLTDWMFELQPPPPAVDEKDAAAQRGKALFESAEVGCASCHSGAKFTDSKSYEVGTSAPGHKLQVPSLVGVAYRTPLIHTGCAPTLEARFDPGCGGGDLHGHTSDLSAEELGDLVSYLRTL